MVTQHDTPRAGTSADEQPVPLVSDRGRRRLPAILQGGPQRLDRRYVPLAGALLVFGVMLLVGGLRYDNFLSGAVMSNLFINNAFLIVIAVGMTFVILTGGIDLSVGAVAALSGILAVYMFQAGWPALVVIPMSILVGSLIGLVVGVMIHYFEVQPFIATLAAMFLARGLCYVISLSAIPITNDTIVAISGTRYTLGGG